MPTLNTIDPENVAHGSEILIQAMGPAGSWVTVGEIYEMDYSEDHKMEDLPIFGSRRTGRRRGRIDIKGTIKMYWLNSTARSMWAGVPTPVTTGAASGSLYHSAIPFVRYQIVVQANLITPGRNVAPLLVFVNVTFSKDSVKFNSDKLTTEDWTFDAEDIQGQ